LIGIYNKEITGIALGDQQPPVRKKGHAPGMIQAADEIVDLEVDPRLGLKGCDLSPHHCGNGEEQKG